MHKISSKPLYESIHVKIYLQEFVSITCHFYLQSSAKVFFTTGT